MSPESISRRRRRFSLSALVAIALVASMTLSSCATIGYYGHTLWGGAKILAKRKPIERLLERERFAAAEREALREVLEIRAFASQSLGLPDNQSYRSLVDLERDETSWIVTATPELSMVPVEWCFPIAGCVTYRGYFSLGKAQRFAERVAEGGYDTAIGAVAAYSTLGWFADPLFASQLEWPRWRLAALVFHELSHELVYVQGDTALNESFATAVEEWGLDRWLEDDPDSRRAARRAAELEAEFTHLVLETRRELQRLYRGALPDDEKRRRKQELLDSMRSSYFERASDAAEGPVYELWFDRPLNNAHLAAIADYSVWVPGLRRLLDERGLDGLVRAVEALAKLNEEARREHLREWNAAAEAADDVSAPDESV